MLTYILSALIGGYALFLLGFALFMYLENLKFGDNQFTMKLLPPPPRLAASAASSLAASSSPPDPSSDWTAKPDGTAGHPARSAPTTAFQPIR